MITRKRTTIQFSEVQCRTLEEIAKSKGIAKPTIPGMLAFLISETPEFLTESVVYGIEQKLEQGNV